VQTTQFAGNCASWTTITPDLPLAIALSEKSDTPDYVDIEAAVTIQSLPGFFGGAGYLGLAVVHSGTPYAGGTASSEWLPGFDAGPQARDTTTWETLRLADPAVTFEPLENWFDGAPKRNKLQPFAF
jgi:hypothetical protein